MAIKIQSLRAWIRRKLGEPVVCVEMTDEQVDLAIEDAFTWWSSYRGWYVQGSISVIAGKAEYDLSAYVPSVIDVMKVWWTDDPRFMIQGAWPGFLDVDGFPYDDVISNEAQGGFYSGLVQWMQTREMAARIMSADRDWFFNDKTKVLTVTPTTEYDTGAAVFMYQTPFKATYLSLLPPDQEYLIKERALAESKYILGRIRGKYTGGLPAAQGNVTLDGGDLLQEAQADFERLEQKMLDLMPPPGIVVG